MDMGEREQFYTERGKGLAFDPTGLVVIVTDDG